MRFYYRITALITILVFLLCCPFFFVYGEDADGGTGQELTEDSGEQSAGGLDEGEAGDSEEGEGGEEEEEQQEEVEEQQEDQEGGQEETGEEGDQAEEGSGETPEEEMEEETSEENSEDSEENPPDGSGSDSGGEDDNPPPVVQVYISEIAWMGTAASGNDEWIELYNPGDVSADLAGWVLRSQDMSFEVDLAGTIESGGYFLLERTDDTTVSDIPADGIYTGALKNDGVYLELVDSLGRVVDQVDTWYAGDNSLKTTMERADYSLSGVNPAGWCTNNGVFVNGLDADENTLSATPRGVNSCGIPTEETDEDQTEEDGGETGEEEEDGSGEDSGGESESDQSSEGPEDQSGEEGDEEGEEGSEEGGEQEENDGSSEEDGGGEEQEAEAPNQPPVPVIQIQGDSAYMHVNVTGGDSYDPEGGDLVYLWDYGDGHTDSAENPKSYYYSAPGAKTITLTVTDESGLSGMASESWTATEKASSKSSASDDGTSSVVYVAPAKSYRKGAITIDRVLPNPEGKDSGAEAILFKNNLSESIDLAGWKLADLKGSHTFSDSIIIPSKSSLQLSQEVFKISLNNNAETLFLHDPVGNLIDEMSWTDASSGQWMINLAFLYDGISGPVLDVLDGDTFKALIDGREFSVRLIGVDTPETIHPNMPEQEGGSEASAFLTNLLQGQSVRLEFDADKMDVYGRLLAYVYQGGLFVNAEIVRQGYSYAYTKYPFKYKDDFISYENEAKAAGLGLWAGGAVKKVLEEKEDEEIENQKSKIEEENSESEEEEIPETDNRAEDDVQENSECNSDFLKIDSFLPNPQKGEETEYIRLINTGTETVCLSGWQIDDIQGGGSRPFPVRGGSIAPGGMRTFRQDETKIALNNKDDCVFLLRPDGLVADQICYGKTHKNEIFTHNGGDYLKSETLNSKSETSSKLKIQNSKNTKYSFDRDAVFYSQEASAQNVMGRIDYVYQPGKVMYLALEDNSIIPVSYADSLVDMAVADEFLDPGQPVEVKIYGAGDDQQLVAIDALASPDVIPEKRRTPFIWYFLFFLFVTGGVYIAGRVKRRWLT